MKNKSFSVTATVLLSHLMIILGLDLLVLLVIDVFFNHAMNFLGSNFFRYGCILFILCGLFLSVLIVASQRKKERD